MSIDVQRLQKALNLSLSLRGRGLALSVEAGQLHVQDGQRHVELVGRDQITLDHCRDELTDLVAAGERGQITAPLCEDVRPWFYRLSPTRQQQHSVLSRLVARQGHLALAEAEAQAKDLLEEFWGSKPPPFEGPRRRL
jgi:hypothetical protein